MPINDANAGMLLLNIAIAVTSAAVLGLLAERAIRRRPAPLRYGVLLAALLLCLAAPGTVWLAQRMDVGLFRMHSPFPANPTTPVESRQEFAPAQPESQSALASKEHRAPRLVDRLGPIEIILLAVAGGIILGMLRLLRGAVLIGRLKRSLTVPQNGKLQAVADRAAQVLALAAAPPIRLSPLIMTPLSFGILSPKIIFPTALENSLGCDELEGILLHETAHIAHHDHLIGIFQRIAGIALWWHPLVHLLNSRAAEVREDICDNYVLKVQGDGERFARCLVDMAERTTQFHRMPMAVGLLHPRKSFEARIKSLLRKERNTMTRLNLAAVAMILLFAGFSFGWIAFVNVRAAEGDSAPVPVPDVIDSSLSWNASTTKLDQEKDILLLNGNAVLRRGKTTIRADKISLARKQGVARISGHVQIQSGDSYLTADEAELNVTTGKLNVTGAAVGAPPDLLVANIEVRGLKRIKEQAALDLIKTKVGQQFDRKIWDEDFHRLYDSGLFLNVRSTEPVITDGKLNVALDLIEKALISQISVDGNAALKDGEILNAIHSREGGPFDPGEAHKDKVRIQQLYDDKKLTAKVDYTIKTLSKHQQTIGGQIVEVQDEVQVTFRIDEAR